MITTISTGYTQREVAYAEGKNNASVSAKIQIMDDVLNTGKSWVCVYAPDGRCAVIAKELKSDYLNVGWYDEPVMNVFARDGRSMVIKNRELDAYTKVGWYADLDDVSSVMIAPNGNKERVFADYFSYYFSLGYRFEGDPYIDPSKPMVALTFDDGPGVYTNDVIKCLVENNSRATFFFVGQNVAQYPSVVKTAFESGMELGNHTYSHPNLTSLSNYNVSLQLNKTANAIYNASGAYPTVMRPPYGSINSRVCSLISTPIITWSLDTLDWKTRSANSTYNSVISKVKDGDIVLMHDIHKPTLQAVQMLVPKLRQMGYQLVTVSELAKYKNIKLSPGITYNSIR